MDGTTQIQNGRGCVSCHQVPYGIWGMAEARRAGVDYPSDGLEDLTERAWTSESGSAAGMIWAPLLLGREPAGNATPQIAATIQRVAGAQENDGTWKPSGQFPGQRESSNVERYAFATA